MYTVAILLHLTYQLTDIQNADAVAYRSNLTWVGMDVKLMVA